MIVLAYPLLLLLLGLPLVFYYILPAIKGLHGDALKLPFIADLKRISIISGGLWNSATISGFSKRFWIVYFLWVLLCLAISRPQFVGEPQLLQRDSRDIMLVLDISTSMLEPDFSYMGKRITRLEAVKNVVSEFTDKRADDRIGLILFGTRAYLQAPLTFDKSSVKNILWSMQAGMAGDSTSIGDALALALKNLRLADDKQEKVIILLTDGESNDGSISVNQAIKMAADEKIKTYTIGVGSANNFFKMLSLSAPGVDEQALNALAQMTQGQYFRAENTSDLQKIYRLIDQLEPSQKDERYIRETTELYYIPLLVAIFISLVLAYALKEKR